MQCTLCDLIGDEVLFSKTQRRKTPSSRKCMKCVGKLNEEQMTGKKTTVSGKVEEQPMLKNAQVRLAEKNKNCKLSLGSPAEKVGHVKKVKRKADSDVEESGSCSDRTDTLSLEPAISPDTIANEKEAVQSKKAEVVLHSSVSNVTNNVSQNTTSINSAVVEISDKISEAFSPKAKKCFLRLVNVYHDDFDNENERLAKALRTTSFYQKRGKMDKLESIIERKYGWKNNGAKRKKEREELTLLLSKHNVKGEQIKKATFKDVRNIWKKILKSELENQPLELQLLLESLRDSQSNQSKEEQVKKKRHESMDSSSGNLTLEKKRKHESNKCDKCDGNHASSSCPYYKKAREAHPDAQRRKGIVDIGSDGGNVRIDSSQARVKHQPGDGSCLYHSLRYGLGGATAGVSSTRALRCSLADWVRKHANDKIADTAVRDWVRWDANCSVDAYAHRMRSSSWGGGIEMAACAREYNVRIFVWERTHRGYKRISCFSSPRACKTLNVLYCGGIHYDYLEVYADLDAITKSKGKNFSSNQNHRSTKPQKVQFDQRRSSKPFKQSFGRKKKNQGRRGGFRF